MFQYVLYLGKWGVLVSYIYLLPSDNALASPHLPALFTCLLLAR